MILRGPQLSERRLVLPVLTAAPSVDSSLAQVSLEARQVATNSVSKVEHATVAPAVALAVTEAREPQLSFEAVVAWLAVQDEQTRGSCAAILASELTKIYENAKKDGFEAGRASAEVAGRKELEKLTAGIQKIAEVAESAFAHEQLQLREICVEVIAEALAKIGGPLLSSKQAAIGAVKQVVDRVKEGRELTIKIAREDIELAPAMEAVLSSALSGRKYEIVADAKVELGGCIVETKLGNLDGRLEVQLRELYETLRLAKLSTSELA